MHRSPAPTTSRVEHAAWRPLRLTALFLLVLTAAACAGRPSAQMTYGPTNTPAIVWNQTIGCVSPSRPSAAGGCIVQDAATGISLRVTDAYADVTSTVVRLETANTDGYPLGMRDVQLALPSGYILRQGLGGYWGGPVSLITDEPLRAEEFGQPVRFIASTHLMPPVYHGLYPPTLPPAPPWLDELDRITLRVPFALAPVRSGGYTYQQAPVIKQGIGVQVQALDLSPSRTAFYGPAGGARIELLFSGLPADLELLSFVRLQSRLSIAGGTSGDVGPGRVELQIPGMTVSTPAMTFLQHPAWPDTAQGPSVDPTVGAAGTIQLEVSYQGSGVPTGQPATLSISNILLLTGGTDGNMGTSPRLPTYQITLPLH
jgi:hypothetical protein